MEIFAKNDAFIKKTNENPEGSFKLKHNKFSTMTKDEFSRVLGRLPAKASNAKTVELPTDNLADSINWIEKGAVNPVQDQGECGSCWAFSAVASMEAEHFIKTGELLKLSEQQLVDCDPQSEGCDGGLDSWAFEYAKTNGLELETDYSYTGQTGKTCNADATKELVEATEYVHVPPKSVTQMKAALNEQPVSVSVCGDSYIMLYDHGIIDARDCCKKLDHAVTIVGYGTSDKGVDYFLVRNSWGKSWGEDGYFRVITEEDGAKGICGILKDSNRPTTN